MYNQGKCQFSALSVMFVQPPEWFSNTDNFYFSQWVVL